MSLLTNRLTLHSESHNLLPEEQFGFRKNKNTISATSILNEIVRNRFDSKNRTYCAFIDFRKAFDSIDHSILFPKLQILGFPLQIIHLIQNIFQQLQFNIRSDDIISPPFNFNIGTPQGDPLSPLLFSLFISDLPISLTHPGIKLNNHNIRCLLYADDLVIIAENPTDLQSALNSLFQYSITNNLTVNTDKSNVELNKNRN